MDKTEPPDTFAANETETKISESYFVNVVQIHENNTIDIVNTVVARTFRYSTEMTRDLLPGFLI